MPKPYDRAYFDKWYRNPRFRVTTGAYLERKIRLAVSVAEYYLGRPVRTVLDVGCGEAPWFPVLRTLRPRVRYTGLDPSDYAVRRFGRSRNVRPGSFAQLGELRFDTTFDLVVCSDVLHYVPGSDLARGLRGVAELLEGVAFLELYTTRDAPTGDLHGFIARSAAWYRSAFARAGLVACGTHCYLGPKLRDSVSALEVYG